jgi:RNA polymerase sigma-B factor
MAPSQLAQRERPRVVGTSAPRSATGDQTRRAVDAATVDAWCAEYASTRDRALRATIVECHQWLVRACARRLLRRNELLDDLVQVGNIGLLKALDRYDPTFGVSFHTYASATIVGELRRHYRSVWMLRVPRSMQERHLAVRAAFQRLETDLSRTPTMAEVAGFLDLTVAEAAEALALGSQTWVGSFSNEREDGTGEPVAPRDETAVADDRLSASALLRRLPPRERTVLFLSHYSGLTQEEIGGRMGMTQVQVSRLMRRSLDRLRLDLTTARSA